MPRLSQRLLAAWGFGMRPGRRAASLPLLRIMQLEDRIAPAVFEVTNLNDVGPGSLRQAIADANANAGPDVINFTVSPGTIALTTGEIAISDAVTINGGGHTVSGSSVSRIFNITTAPVGTEVVMNKLVLLGGNTSLSGGAIIGGTQILTLTDMTLSKNTASTDGGAIFMNSTGTVNLVRTAAFGNSGKYGGVVSFFSSGGSLNVINSTLSGNSASNSGGALYMVGSVSGSGISVRNSTIVGNTSGTGGGIFRSSNLPVAIESSIISGNTAGSGPDIFSAKSIDLNFSAVGSAAGFTFTGADNLPFGTDLKLGALSSNGGPTKTILPAADSPVRDAGSNPGALTIDQRGLPRVWNGQADIGAVELDPLFIVRNTSDAGRDSLRQQVLDANAFPGKDTITFDPGLGAATITLTGGQLVISDAVTIQGSGQTISGNNASRIFNLESAPSSTPFAISNLTLTKGKAVTGGAISADDQLLTIEDVRFVNNRSTTDGGAIYLFGFGSISMNRSLLQDNQSNSGGGISFFTTGGSLTVTNSTLVGNAAVAEGGGMLFFGSIGGDGLIIRNSTIVGNSGSSGGGIYRSSSRPFTIDSSIVSGNTAADGPDIRAFNTQPTVNFSALGKAAGFTIASGGNNLPFETNLKLRAPANNGGPGNTIAFEHDSPLRNAGSNPLGLTIDQRGFPRDSGGVDIGAFELNTLVTNANDSGPGSLRDAMAEANRVAGADVITFDASFITAKTITLTTGEIAITDAVTVAGTGAKLLTISGNNASRIFNTIFGPPGMPVVVNQLSLANGNSMQGAAIWISDEQLTLNKVSIRNNTSSDDGGGIYVSESGTLTVNDSTFHDNSAKWGGAISFFPTGGTLILSNSTISGNTASASGGGLYFAGSTAGSGVTIRNSTITGNQSDIGGGLGLTTNLSTSISSSIVSGNTAGSIGPDIRSNTKAINVSHSAIGVASDWTFGSGSNNLPFGIDVKLGSLADNGGPTLTHLPLAGSPLINAGSNPAGLTTDQRGEPREVGQTDIGSVEIPPASVSGLVVNDGADQRSRITQIDLVFDNVVTAADYQSIFLTRIASTTTGGTAGFIVNTGNGLTITQVNATTLRLSFANLANNGVEFGSLADGRWQLSVPVSNYTSNDADPAQRIRRLFGDADGNGTVDSADFAYFGSAFGGSTGLAFDFDNNGTVDSTDFAFFGARFGVSLG